MIMKTILCAMFLIILSGFAYAVPQIYIYADVRADSAFAESMINLAHNRIRALIGEIQYDSLDIYIVNSENRFLELAGNAVPDWGAAVAIPYKKRIVIKSPLIIPGDQSLGELLAHEYTHIYLARRVNYKEIPRWFNEGMAMYLSAEWGWQNNLSMSWNSVFGNTIPLKDIQNLNRFQTEKAALAYAESYLALKYFIDTYGVSGLNLFLDYIRAGHSFDESFRAATGAGCKPFENEFGLFLAGRYNLISLIFNSNLMWIIMAGVIIVGYILTRIRRKSRMEELDEYDKLHSTDFDYGDEPEKPHEDNRWD